MVFVLCAQAGISYMAIDARDDAAFRILDDCLQPASQFIAAAHSRGVGVLVHCMAGVNRCYFCCCVESIGIVLTAAAQICDADHCALDGIRKQATQNPPAAATPRLTV